MRTQDIPPQIGSEAEAETMASAGFAASSSAVATGAVQVVMGFVLQAGLGQLWSMLNS